MAVRLRFSALAAALAVSVLLLAGAWPQVGTHFNRTAIAHFYPGGGLRAALHRLWHPPAIDPRAPVGIALLDRYVKQRRVIILLPTVPDLGTEILIRSHRSNLLPIGDPKADGLVPSVWLPRVRAALAGVRRGSADPDRRRGAEGDPGSAQPSVDPLKAPVDGGGVEAEWILRYLDQRFVVKPVVRAPDGLVVAELEAR